MKKIVAGALALGMLCAASGCGDKKQAGTEENANTFTYWCSMNGAISAAYKSLNEMAMYQELERITGVHIDFIHPTGDQAVEQFNLMVASRNLPDMVEYNWSTYPGGPDKAIKDNLIVSLNDYMDELPNLKKWVTNDDVIEKGSKTDSGQYYGFPSINTSNYFSFSGLMLRQDWLDQVNLPVPETIAQWDTVLRAFKNQLGVESPLTGQKWMIQMTDTDSTFNNGFGVAKALFVEDGKVKFGPLEPGYKEWIAQLQTWYADKILDNDFMTNTGNIVEAKMTNGTSGAVFGPVGGSMGVYLTRMKDDPSYKLVGAPYPAKEEGAPAYFKASAYTGKVTDPFLCITNKCKDPKGAAKWMDYLYSDEGYMLFNFGIEGKTYQMVDGKPVYTDEILHNPNGYSIVEAMCRNMKSAYTAPGLNQAPEYLEQYYQEQSQRDAFEVWEKYPETTELHLLPNLTFPYEVSGELATLKTELITYCEESITRFVTGEQSMGQFDTFVNQLKSMGVDRYIEINQKAYDTYMAR